MLQSKKRISALLIATITCSVLILGCVGVVATQTRAILVSPRLSAPLCAGQTDGSWDSSTITGSLEIIIGTDPAEIAVPNVWIDENNWDIRISHSVIDNCSLIPLKINSIAKTVNPSVSVGIDDSSSIIKNAIKITVSIPKQVDPCLYDLFIGYQTNLDSLNDINTAPGSFLGEKGTANLNPDAFVLSEPNAIYVPSEDDPLASDPVNSNDPFSLIQITDIHTATDDSGDWSNQLKMDALSQALSIWAPDVIVGTGDITNDPDDYPVEHLRSYEYYKNLGLPVIFSNGNHDQGNLGLWGYYFGPLTSSIDWMGNQIVSFNSAYQISSQLSSWVTSEISTYASEKPVFLSSHIPLYDVLGRQNQGYSGAIIDSMVKNGGTAILNGHNHYDLVMDGEKALEIYLDAIKTTSVSLGLEVYKDACHVPDLVGDEAPDAEGTKIIITTTAAKEARGYKLQDSGVWSDYEEDLGYRRITVADNQMVNYTYDKNDDGKRDPSYSTPLWNLTGTIDIDENHLENGANYTINNGLTEEIESARMAFVLPLSEGKTWTPKNTMGVENIDYIERYRVSNSTHEFIEYRIKVPARIDASTPSTVKFELELIND